MGTARGRSIRLSLTLTVVIILVAGASQGSAASSEIFTSVGTGSPGFGGDGGLAAAARLNVPVEVAAAPGGGYAISDQGNHRIRRVLADGRITTIAGNGTQGFAGDGGPATGAQLSAPNGLAFMPDGAVLIADSNNNRVRRVSPSGIITTVAGTGVPGFGGDAGPAASAQLNFPSGLAATPDGGYLIADNDNHRVRRVSPAGIITTVAGTGVPTFGGDGGAATAAQLNDPTDVAVAAGGGFLIADLLNQRVRRVSATGTITTAAGTGVAGFGGDGGPATAARLNNPISVTATADGGYLVTDRSNNRVRRVSPAGTIATAAGTGIAGFGGDGGPATAARLNLPIGVSVNRDGAFLIADTLNHRIRAVDTVDAPVAQPPRLPPPVLGRFVNVELVRGRVLIAVPRGATAGGSATAAQKGLRFVPLTAARQIPVRSFLNTRRGTVRLVSATPRAGVSQAGQFSGGLFQVLQSRRRRARGLTELRLKGSSFRRCRRSSGRRAAAAQRRRRSRRVIRRLRSNARGRFRTRGRYSAATVRGTVWSTSDRCDGTLTKVTRGRVTVRDLRRKRTITLRRGKSYLARAPR
jgi:sugar lactone lactonase YvrE